MQLGDIQTIVRANVDDAAADVDQCIVDAVNYLNNFFYVPKTDETQSAVVDQDYLDIPAASLKVRRLKIGDDFISELADYENLEDVDDVGKMRWYECNGKIELTLEMSSTDPVIIWFDSEFTQPEAAVDTDVPNKLLELVYTGATYRFFDKLAAKVATNRQKYPDVSPREIDGMRKQWKDRFDNLLEDLTP